MEDCLPSSLNLSLLYPAYKHSLTSRFGSVSPFAIRSCNRSHSAAFEPDESKPLSSISFRSSSTVSAAKSNSGTISPGGSLSTNADRFAAADDAAETADAAEAAEAALEVTEWSSTACSSASSGS